MTQAKIVKVLPTDRDYFVTTTKNTAISQRETLEKIIVNLATALGVEIIHKQLGSSGSCFYEVQARSFSGFQSASNTILELSRRLGNGSNA